MAKVLIIAPQWMGDAVMTHSLVQLLAKNHTVDVLCVEWLSPIYQRMAEVNNVIALPLKHGKFQIGLYWKIAQSIKGHYQQAYIIPRKLKSALIPWLAGIPIRTGYLGESRYWLINDRVQPITKHKLWVEKVCDLSGVAFSDNPLLRVNQERAAYWKKRLGQTDKKLIALMPGASYGPSKQWPIDNFCQLVKTNKNAIFIVLGGEKEHAIGEKIKHENNEQVINLCNKTTLKDAVDILSGCDECITNDSGLMHVAAAVGCFVKALYGSSSPNYTPPLTHNKKIFSDALECKPCFERTCQFGHYDCWKKITASKVLELK